MMKLKLLAGGEEPLLNCPQCIALKQMQIAKLDQKKIKPKEGGSLGGKFPSSKPERKIAHDYPFTIFLQIAFYPAAIIRQHIQNENELWAR